MHSSPASSSQLPPRSVAAAPTAHVHALEQQLELAMRQVDSTRRLYDRLHQHNDEMEDEFLRLRGILEELRNGIHFNVRHEVHRLRNDVNSVRDTVNFHTNTFQRELQALERVLCSAISSGKVMECDHEILFHGSGSVPNNKSKTHSARNGEGKHSAVSAPPPVTPIFSPPPKPGAQGKPSTNPLEQVSLKKAKDDVQARIIAYRKKKTAQKQRETGEQQDSSIEFFSEAEGNTPMRSSNDKASEDHLLHSPGTATNGGGGGGKPSNKQAGGTSTIVTQAVELAQQRAIAERQGRQIALLADDTKSLQDEKRQLQEKLRRQEEQFQLHLKQLKDVHREQELTLRGQLDMMSNVALGRTVAATVAEAGVADDDGFSSPRSTATSAAKHSQAASERSKHSESSHHNRKRQLHLLRKQAHAEEMARVMLDQMTEAKKAPRNGKHHSRDISPSTEAGFGGASVGGRNRDEADVIAEGLWAQRVLEKRATRPLFPAKAGTAPASRSSSVQSGASNGRCAKQETCRPGADGYAKKSTLSRSALRT